MGQGTPPLPSTALKVAAFTGGPNQPATRFRVRQYVPALARLGIDLRPDDPRYGAYPPARRWLRPAWAVASLAERLPAIAAGWSADVTLLQREMLSTFATIEGFTRRPRILDVDDAIHLYGGGRPAARLAGSCALVICGNTWLAGHYAGLGCPVAVLPTPVEPADYPLRPPPEPPVIGWIGSAGNLRYLEALGPALAAVLDRFPGATVAVCCDRPPRFTQRQLAGERLRFTPWSPGIEGAFVAGLAAGLMPLDDTPWERGKCSFKMLQYMAAARPAVVSPVGMNAEVLASGPVGLAAGSQEEWVEALSSLLAAPERAAAMGHAGRGLVEAKFSVASLAPRLAGLIRGVAGAS